MESMLVYKLVSHSTLCVPLFHPTYQPPPSHSLPLPHLLSHSLPPSYPPSLSRSLPPSTPPSLTTTGHWGGERNSAQPDPAALYREDLDFLTVLRDAHVTMYSFGAPRCGNPKFCDVSFYYFINRI